MNHQDSVASGSRVQAEWVPRQETEVGLLNSKVLEVRGHLSSVREAIIQ